MSSSKIGLICSFIVSRILLSRWIFLPFAVYSIQWACVYYYDSLNPETPQLTGDHLLPDRDKWCVMDNVIRPTRQINRDRITLILHMTSDYLSEDIAEHFHNWSGPIALTIVLNDISRFGCAVLFMRSLIERHSFRMIQVHFMYKKDSFGRCHNSEVNSLISPNTQTHCSRPVNKRSLIDVADYPMNMARNVARQFIKTEFLLLSDVDLLFTGGFERRMLQVARRELKEGVKKALVFRIFEVYNQSSTPRTKWELSQLLDSGNADVFHVHAAFGAHGLAGTSSWLSKPENFTHTNVVPRPITFSRYTWEPRFVSRSSVPLHDEAFPYRYRANCVLGWEMCRAGYEFTLVEDLFTFHRGKRVNDPERREENHKIQLMNRLKYERALAGFYSRMDKEYPDTKGSCPAILRRIMWFFKEE